jgi:excisionase family DNA binding protein
MSTVDNEPLLTVRETAVRLRASKEKTYRLIRSGQLPAHRIGGSLRVDPAELKTYIADSPATREATA